MHSGIPAARAQRDEQQQREQNSDPQLQQHDLVEAQDELLQLQLGFGGSRLGRVPHRMINGWDRQFRPRPAPARLPSRQAETPVEVHPPCRDQHGLREQQQQERSHEDGVHVQDQREWRPRARPHNSIFINESGMKPVSVMTMKLAAVNT